VYVGVGFRSCERIGDEGSDPKGCCWICDIPPEGLTPCPQFVHSFFSRRLRECHGNAAQDRWATARSSVEEYFKRILQLHVFWRNVSSLFLRKPIGDQIMSRRVYRLLLGLALLSLTTGVSGQSTQPSTANGEWPHYTADLKGTRYSPLDQINASNFNKLEIAWRFKTDSLGPFPEFKLESTPLMVKGVLYTTGGTRRSVIALDAKTGELIWAHSLREGKRAAVAPRQLSGRGVAYWTDGKGDERVLYVTTGYRLVALNAKNGAIINSFGKDGVVDLKVG